MEETSPVFGLDWLLLLIPERYREKTRKMVISVLIFRIVLVIVLCVSMCVCARAVLAISC